MTVRPRVLGHRVLLKPLDANETTSGGVVLPDEARGKETRGVVVAVGERCGTPYCPCSHESYEERLEEREPLVEVGQVVVYAENGTRNYGHPCRVSVDQGEDGVAEELIVVGIDDLLLVLDDVESGVRA